MMRESNMYNIRFISNIFISEYNLLNDNKDIILNEIIYRWEKYNYIKEEINM